MTSIHHPWLLVWLMATIVRRTLGLRLVLLNARRMLDSNR